MEKLDFEFDMERTERELLRGQNGLQSASVRLWEAIEDWPGLVQNYYSKVATIDISRDSEKLTGTVLGKSFSLAFGVVSEAGTGHVEVILWVPTLLSNEKVELGRFLVTPYGDVLTKEKEQLLGRQDEFLSYKLLTSILRKVAATPAPF